MRTNLRCGRVEIRWQPQSRREHGPRGGQDGREDRSSEIKQALVPVKGSPSTSARRHPRSSVPGAPARGIVRAKIFDFGLLTTLGVAEGVREYFKAIGWEGFPEWRGTVYPTLVGEFIQSLNAKSPARINLTTECVFFKLTGKDFSLSLNDLNTSLGITAAQEVKKAITYIPEHTDEEWVNKWKEIGLGHTFGLGYTKGNAIKDGALRMCHRLLAYSFFGKVDSSNSVSQQELFLLWYMVNEIKVNFAAFAVAHFRDIVAHPKQRISLAHLVTVLGKTLKVLDEGDEALEFYEESYIDRAMLARAGDIEMWGGQPYLLPATLMTKSASPAPSAMKKKGAMIQEGDEVSTRLAHIEEQQKATHDALLAYFEHVGFRYPASPN